MKETPILFSGPLVRATLEDRKTQTRRLRGLDLINEEPDRYKCHGIDEDRDHAVLFEDLRPEITPWIAPIKCPYGQPGDRLWVRETFSEGYTVKRGPNDERIKVPHYTYRADEEGRGLEGVFIQGTPKRPVRTMADLQVWKPSIHMPRAASRITLEITGVRVERLQEISADDALAEGVSKTDLWNPKEVDENPKPIHEWKDPYWDDFYFWKHYPQTVFQKLWDKINGRKYPWSSNPWVWCISFRRIDG